MSGVLLLSSTVEPVRCKYDFMRSVNVSFGAGFGTLGGLTWLGSTCCAKANPEINAIAIDTLVISNLLIFLPIFPKAKTLFLYFFIRHRLRLTLVLDHILIEYRRVLVGDSKQFGHRHSERVVADAGLSRRRESRANVSLPVDEKRRERPVIGFEQPLKQLLAIGGARQREVPPSQLRINCQYQRLVLSNLNIQVEPFSVLVFAARRHQSVRVLRMRHIAQSHLLEVPPQRRRGDPLLLGPARSDRKNSGCQNRTANTSFH